MCIFAYQRFFAEFSTELSLLYKVVLFGLVVGAVAAYLRLSRQTARAKAAALEKATI